MPIGTVTCGANSVQIQTTGRAMQIVFNPAANNYTYGDSSSLNATTGISMLSTATVPQAVGPFTSGAINLNQWYVFGASGTVIRYQYTAEE